MSAVIVIPARHASTRLPGKPLLKETGKYLIQHVYERACRCRRARAVIVATDDPRIVAAVEGFGGRVVLTRKDHPSGTDRVAEVARGLDDDVFVNLQGDEPLIDPAALDLVIGQLVVDGEVPGEALSKPEAPARESTTSLALRAWKDADAGMATLAVPLHSEEQYRNPACVKAVLDDAGNALYFSRAPVPFVRNGRPDFAARPARFFQHVGLYAYRREFLLRFAATPPAPLEQLEKLEQLRALAMGVKIKVGVIHEPTLGVDTYDDYQRFVAIYRRMPREKAA
jgi:3-deoxy-manno-octulosonate cytidylyltransferase (CMP-KDO synthetase)